MALPFLPGNNFNRNLGKNKFHKSHHFDYNNDVSMLVGESKPGIGGDPLLNQKPKTRNSAFPKGTGSHQPAWVAFDGQVLCFEAYFQEAVHEKREEQYRVRNCKIYFYLEDDSIQVIEPRFKNSGIPQGTLIRRHRIPKPPPQDDEFYTVEDFNVGKTVSLYSRTFEITSCDEFTKNFLGKLGTRVNNSKNVPGDPYTGHRKAMDESMQALRPYEKYDTLKQFLDHDRHVLRFFCYWDDTDSMFGDPREMVLHYFLADDTIEIREIIAPNSGRDATPMFLKRQRLPKDVAPLLQPGEVTARTVLNVFGPTGHGGRYILDNLKTGAVANDFYCDSDLTLGSVINVWGRRFVLGDCDDFTKEYYRTKYGITDFKPINFKSSPVPRAAREMPPYNGFGSEEDSLCSCMGLLPKPPRRDFIKFMEKDRHGLDSNVLRFLARMETTKPIDQDRRFIISYFMSDDTILVFEPPVRNSGIIGGKFLERGRVKKPEQPMYSTQLSQYYSAQDLFVGAVVEFNKHRFVLIDADEYAYRYMERHSSELPQANIGSIMSKLKQLAADKKDEIARSVTTSGGGGQMSFEQFGSTLQSLAGNQLTPHEVSTVARFYQDRSEEKLDQATLVAVAQDLLRKVSFENFAQLLEHCRHIDQARSGRLDIDVLRAACHAFKIPLPGDLMVAILSSFNTENGIDYGQMVQSLNWRDCPVPPPAQVPGGTFNPNEWTSTPAKNQVNNVNYGLLIQDLFGIGGQGS